MGLNQNHSFEPLYKKLEILKLEDTRYETPI